MTRVSANFDSGNIELVGSSPSSLELSIRPDAGGDHYQWFHFRVSGRARCQLVIINAKGASYEEGWRGYRACASYDRHTWFRVPTTYEQGRLIIEHAPTRPVTWYAYFAPYDYERHQRLIAWAQCEEGVALSEVGRTIDGRPIDLLEIGDGATPLWIIGRQHPGESMAEWLIEGLLERLLDPADELSISLRKRARFFVVPNMNPDGSVRGHLRNNAAGANLNREWETPTVERSPEVFYVRQRMDEAGVRFCLDVHGDEAMPYNFMASPHGVAELPETILAASDAYCMRLAQVCPDFQTAHGYPRTPKGKANLTIASNQLAARFGALAMTLEQPFKDNADAPRPEGWSPARAKALGRAQLDALAHVLERL